MSPLTQGLNYRSACDYLVHLRLFTDYKMRDLERLLYVKFLGGLLRGVDLIKPASMYVRPSVRTPVRLYVHKRYPRFE